MPFLEKIITRENAQTLSSGLQRSGKSIGFTSGSFDIFHAGHLSYLESAKSKCDILFVGVNSDLSVKAYKDPRRPILSESDRASVIAGLAAVDYVFIFSELNNKENLYALKPNIYFKAGDYTVEKLSSAKYLEEWGGKAIIEPFKNGISTTEIINRILSKHMDLQPSYIGLNSKEKTPAIFLDRDGVINQEVEYLHKPEQFELIPGVIPALKTFMAHGFKIIIVTTQAGIGLGYFTKEDLFKVNKHFLTLMHKEGIVIDKVYFCPHSVADKCECRKPGIALFLRGAEDCHIDMSRSFMVGDKTSDILAGKNAGLKTILVNTGHAGKDGGYVVEPDHRAEDLLEASKWIVNGKR